MIIPFKPNLDYGSKKVSDILKENSMEKQINVINFVKYKVGEGI